MGRGPVTGPPVPTRVLDCRRPILVTGFEAGLYYHKQSHREAGRLPKQALSR